MYDDTEEKICLSNV